MADLNKIIDELSKLTVVEAAELSKQLEEKWGVTAAAPVAAAATTAPAAEEKSEFTIFLASVGDKKINVIKEVRSITGLGLKEAKDVAQIATLPTLDEARARIVGIFSSPAKKILSILLAPGSKIAILAHAKSKKN